MGAPNTTPGIWAVEDEPYRHIRAKDGSQGGWGSTVYDASYPPSDADAHQIAASGDLYDALAEYLFAEEIDDPAERQAELAVARRGAALALAKARGEAL